MLSYSLQGLVSSAMQARAFILISSVINIFSGKATSFHWWHILMNWTSLLKSFPPNGQNWAGRSALADGQYAQCLALIETSAYAYVDHVGEKNLLINKNTEVKPIFAGDSPVQHQKLNIN